MSKKELRKKVLAQRDKMSVDEINRRSKILLDKVKEMDVYKNSHTILIYVSFGTEINTHPFIKESIELGKNVITPICNTKDKTLILGKTTSFPEGFKETTKYGILELDPNECEHVEPKDLDLIIMPGVAFTKKGDRMGYGAGYYDRLLAVKRDDTITLAPVFEEFVFDEIPTDPHDKPIDYIVTESAIYKNI